MDEKPILFSGPMVKAILDGRKTQTRRVCKKALFEDQWAGAVHPAKESGWISWYPGNTSPEFTKMVYDVGFECPHGSVGDRLWVRETWAMSCYPNEDPLYRADYNDSKFIKWKPSIFMPRWASRITLEITNVRVERVQDITEEDCDKEGIFNQSGLHLHNCSGKQFHPDQSCKCGNNSPQEEFAKLWDSINGKKYPWESNPWVWVIEFKRI